MSTRTAEQRLQENIGFVVLRAQYYSRCYGVDFDDLVQQGRLGVVRAHERFDPARGFTFLSYARHWINQQMTNWCQRHVKNIRVPAYQFGKVFIEEVSLHAPAGEDGTIADSLGAEETVRSSLDRRERAELLERAVTGLDERERHIIQGRFFEDRTLEDIAGDFGLSRERIRQIEFGALRRLRKALAALNPT